MFSHNKKDKKNIPVTVLAPVGLQMSAPRVLQVIKFENVFSLGHQMSLAGVRESMSGGERGDGGTSAGGVPV